MDVLAEGLQALAETMSETASTPVLYRRTNSESAVLNVTLGETTREQAIDDGMINVVRRLDFHVSVAEFTGAFGWDVKPHEGDTVEIHGQQWQVRPFGGEPGWRYADPHRTRFRVHLLEV